MLVEVFGRTATPPGSFTCSCADGFADGVCEYSYILPYTAQCTRQQGSCNINVDECASVPCDNGGVCTADVLVHSVYTCECAAGFEGDNCAEDVDECSTDPCLNGATCAQGVDSYSCDCLPGWEGETCANDTDECFSHPCEGGSTCAESSTDSSIPIDTYTCSCEPGFESRSTFGGNCDVDSNECDSNPCQNSAVCVESSTEETVLPDAYRCICSSGFANGLCQYEFLSEYATACGVQESTASSTLSGNCDIDVNECDSNPCVNSAACVESTTDASVVHDAYQCSCNEGYSNGMCNYNFIGQYATDCTVADSRQVIELSGNCDIDLDECVSTPCQNGAKCVESTVDPTVSVNSYQCLCIAGFANGLCDYAVISSYETECGVTESTVNGAFSGNCDIDVNECNSSPCDNGSDCQESMSDISVSYDAYRCLCNPGFANGM
eukprot:COSAG02_NODE_9667_length_2148_cov_1.176184_2_plen_437_part_01